MKTVRTPKGTALPLTNLKGKDYLMTAYRLQWFVEENPLYHVTTTFPVLNDEETVAVCTIHVINDQGQVLRKAMGTKRENLKHFADHTEKAETGALGRALLQLGYGTQYALADLDEGDRIVDSPLVDVKAAARVATETTNTFPKAEEKKEEAAVTKMSSFRKPTTKKVETSDDGEWQ